MTDKNKKSRVSFGSTMKAELYQQLQQLSAETDVPISKLLDKAITLLLDDKQKSSK